MAKKIFGAIWYLIVCGFVLTGASAVGNLNNSRVAGKLGFLKLMNPPKPQATFNSDSQTFLILGCDADYSDKSYTARYYSGQANGNKTPNTKFIAKSAARSDMMMIARMNFATGEITGVSVPRDTWCRLPEDREVHKINSYYKNAEPGHESEAAKRAVEYLTGVAIDKVVVIDFNKMQDLVDMIGGVEVTVPRQMDYDDNAGQLHIHLKPGRQHLNGYQAMGYVRFRHSKDSKFNETDFQRQQREKDMMLGLKDAVKHNWVNNIMKMGTVLDAGAAVLGESLTYDQILSLASFVRGLDQSKIKIGVIPTHDKGNGLELEADKLPKVLAQYKLTQDPSLVSLRQ